ncbi:putative brg-1 associated factor [Schistosoma mansoni]|nr:putative brg-1 associated factor [Schistosoma mansoni]|eukprot:XP_018649762.1 putative brg-1 associated factor [Schistosoma mansoni]
MSTNHINHIWIAHKSEPTNLRRFLVRKGTDHEVQTYIKL